MGAARRRGRLVNSARKLLGAIMIGGALLSSPVQSDQARMARIGVLTPPNNDAAERGLREGLKELGYVEGQNLTLEWRRYAQSSDAIRAAAEDLVRSKVDLIVALSTQAARSALSTTSTIPVVFMSGDPIGGGLAASLAHPGANATGVSSQSTDLIAKRLQLLLQIAPRVRHVLLLVNPDSPLHAVFAEEAERVGRTLHIRIDTLTARNASELDSALRQLHSSGSEALMVSSDLFFSVNKSKIGDAVRKARLPAMAPTKEYQADGVLMSYGSSIEWMSRRVVVYADKILKGAKPGDLPVEQGSTLELVIDQRAARELGLKVPQELLLRADEVIR